MDGARFSVGGDTWQLDEVEWWILRRHWALFGPQGSAIAKLFGTGGTFDAAELRDLRAFFDRFVEQSKTPLTVGTDKYPGIVDWHRRWRELLRASKLPFESWGPTGESAVFRGRVNLTRQDAAARPALQSELAPYASAIRALGEALAKATLGTPLSVSLDQRYEGF